MWFVRRDSCKVESHVNVIVKNSKGMLDRLDHVYRLDGEKQFAQAARETSARLPVDIPTVSTQD